MLYIACCWQERHNIYFYYTRRGNNSGGNVMRANNYALNTMCRNYCSVNTILANHFASIIYLTNPLQWLGQAAMHTITMHFLLMSSWWWTLVLKIRPYIVYCVCTIRTSSTSSPIGSLIETMCACTACLSRKPPTLTLLGLCRNVPYGA